MECGYKVKGEEISKDLKAGRVARCDRCIRELRRAGQAGLKRKRSSNGSSSNKRKKKTYEDSSDNEDDDIAIAGVMKVWNVQCYLLLDLDTVLARHHLFRRRPTSYLP